MLHEADAHPATVSAVDHRPLPTPCMRCGTFATLAAFWGRELCGSCIEQSSSVLERSVTPRSLFLGALALWPHVGLRALLLHHVAELPSLLRSIAGGSPLRGIGWNMLLDSIAAALVVYLGVSAAVSRPVTISGAAGELGRRFGHWSRAILLAGIMIVLWSLALLVPGVTHYIAYMLVSPIALFEPARSAKETLALSAGRMQGQRWPAFIVYFAIFAVACAPATILAIMVDAGDAPMTAPATPAEIVCELVATSVLSLMSLVTAVLYVKVTPPELMPVRRPQSGARG